VLKGAKKPIVLVGQGALARPTAPRCWRSRQGSRRFRRRVKDGWNGFGVLHTRRRASARSISASCRGGRLDAPRIAQMTTFGALDVLFLLGADEIGRGPAPSWSTSAPRRPRRASRRRDPAGRRLHRKSGIYVNTEGRVQMAAAPSSRRARRARTGRSCARCPTCSARSCLRLAGAAAQAMFKATRI
jgi:NADH-quinone oxidoreductase subunit G